MCIRVYVHVHIHVYMYMYVTYMYMYVLHSSIFTVLVYYNLLFFDNFDYVKIHFDKLNYVYVMIYVEDHNSGLRYLTRR